MSRIACCQLAPVVGELAANQDRCLDAIRAALDLGADLVTLPELATSGYVFSSAEEVRANAIPASDPMFERWAEQAVRHDATIVAGFCEAGVDGLLYNSAAVVDRSGACVVYRKVHLWRGESRYFAPGSSSPPVIDVAAGRVGVCICYDLEFPEVPKALARNGAQIVAVPTNWPRGAHHSDFGQPPEVLNAVEAAQVNRLTVACCDRVGNERGQAWLGATSIIDPSGCVVAMVAHEGIAVADIDVDAEWAH